MKIGGNVMVEVSMIHNETEFLEHNQIIKLLKDQMEYIDSPKTNQELIETIRLAFKSTHGKLMVISDNGHVLGFCFFNISIGMESAGKYIWLNEMHIHEQYRNRGYGTMLFDELKKWCKKNNIVRIMGMMDESEKDTKRFYRKQNTEIYSQEIFSLKL